jgi:hypothetical protein
MAISAVNLREDFGEVLWISLMRVVASPILAILISRPADGEDGICFG